MRSTFTKIFLSFWLTEILIFVCTLFILSNQFESSESVYTSVFAMMQSNANQSVQAYETGGCPALMALPNVFPLDEKGPGDLPAILFDPADKPLCQTIDFSVYASSIAKIRKQEFLLAEKHGPGYYEGLQVKNSRGEKYIYLFRGNYPRHVYIPYREMTPRLLIGLIVSLVVTSLITILITRPIGFLRTAARELAAGNLRARVQWPKGKKSPKDSPRSSDELWGLVYDFNNMADRLESLVDAQMLLLRDVSHELRSPLARLSVALELAREESLPAMEPQLERIERETGRLNELIGQLLSLSHLESTRRLPDGQSVRLAEIVRELLPDMDYEAQRRNCRVHFSVSDSPEVSLQVQGSRELLTRAIENVIRNAIAYTAEGTAVEIILLHENRLGEHYALLQVRDQGPGVPEEGLKSIFRPFYRLDSSRQRSTGGYGVGLAITERAIRLHGGEVCAKNHPDSGLIVEMRLPLTPQN